MLEAVKRATAGLALAAAVAAPLAQATAQTAAPTVAAATPAAPQARPLAADPELEARVLEIAAELRCLVCQNETIAASHADLAIDLRNQVREQLRAGKSEREIREYMVARYGDFVLYTPPVKPTTWLLWVGPFILLVAMALVMWRTLVRRRATAVEAPLSDADRERARALLGQKPEPEPGPERKPS
jgi:cytochrome c-type biogenesis protein CcmH